MMSGRMMHSPLSLTHFLDRAKTFFGRNEVVWRRADRTIHRYIYSDFTRRCAQLANGLRSLGVKPGDAVATLGWNSQAHLEAYFAVPCMGAVVHTLNLRLHPKDLAYIVEHAKDKVIIVDESLLPLLDKFRAELRSVEHFIVVADGAKASRDQDYEALLAAQSDAFEWPVLDENSAAMICYTSGTTGSPKGVVYSHRSMTLHALSIGLKDSFGIGEGDTILPVVPMFHASAWGMPYAAVAFGSKLVMPGPHLDGKSLLALISEERVTLAAGVPTIWLGILNELDTNKTAYNTDTVRAMVVGGSAAPEAMIAGFYDRHKLRVIHAWGMTETNPLGTVARVREGLGKLSPEHELSIRASQGFAVPFVEQRITDDAGKVLPWDGKTLGELEVRGPWVAASYIHDEDPDRFTKDGWFKTGDVVTIDADGYVRINDRSKDVIKSGGEWISSVALENALMAHPAVLEAAVFAAKHAQWAERPVAAIAFKPGQSATDDELRALLAPNFAKFWLPDAFVTVPQVPRNSTGKFMKSALREQFGEILIEGKK